MKLRSNPVLRAVVVIVVAFGWAASPSLFAPPDPPVRHIRFTDGALFPDAVGIGNQPLAVTTQVFPISGSQLVGAGDVAYQTQISIRNLEFLLTLVQSSMKYVVRLNVYVTPGAKVELIERAIAENLPRGWTPAVSLVEAELPVPGAMVAMDAVVINDTWAPPGQVNHYRALAMRGSDSASHIAVMPAGRKVFISGQAAAGATMEDATRETFRSLGATLDHLGLGRQHIVQVKAFLQTTNSLDGFERGLVEYFADATIPPLVVVGWTNKNPVEIELLLSAPGAAPANAPAVQFATPPHLSQSPAFSRVAIVNRGRLYYTSSLRPPPGLDAPTQVRETFSRLRSLVQRLNASMLDLPKATYYAAGDDVMKAFRDVRPDYLDAKRPPASSLALEPAVGAPGTRFVMDMIIVVP